MGWRRFQPQEDLGFLRNDRAARRDRETVVDCPDRRGSLTADDEGTPTNYCPIEDGILGVCRIA
jgi:hypothetical protein